MDNWKKGLFVVSRLIGSDLMQNHTFFGDHEEGIDL